MESELGPVETDSDSHRPLMSSEEEEAVEAHIRQCQSVQQSDEPLTECQQAVGFFQAFSLPGVLPVSLTEPTALDWKTFEMFHRIDPVSLSLAVFLGLRVSEVGQLLLLLLAAVLLEQQLRVEGGRGRPPVCVVRRRWDRR